MTKGATHVLIGGGVLVVAVGGVWAFLAARKSALQTPLPVPQGAPPPLNPISDVQIIGTSLLKEGGKALSELGHNSLVTTLTGGESAKSYLAKTALTGGAYVPIKATYSIGSKAVSAIKSLF